MCVGNLFPAASSGLWAAQGLILSLSSPGWLRHREINLTGAQVTWPAVRTSSPWNNSVPDGLRPLLPEQWEMTSLLQVAVGRRNVRRPLPAQP